MEIMIDGVPLLSRPLQQLLSSETAGSAAVSSARVLPRPSRISRAAAAAAAGSTAWRSERSSASCRA